ncbi:MAG: cytochrome c-type biogenesis protein [Pseudomonadota bacterium]
MSERLYRPCSTSRALGTVLAWFCVAWSFGIDTSTLDDPGLRARYEVLIEELRCLVCQNQTIADSNAELAVDLRTQVRKMLVAGRSDDDIRDYMTDRYGDFVLYRPPLKRRTVALWFAPLVGFGLGALALWRVVRRSQRAVTPDDGVARANEPT